MRPLPYEVQMAAFPGVISYPIPLYANVPIHSEYYEPHRFVITAITRGVTTTITTSVAHDYVIAQQVRLILPPLYGARQLNEVQGLVISIPSTTQVVLNIDSQLVDAFIPSPITATITGITQATNAVVTANNSYRVGNLIRIASVGGMTQLNGLQFQVVSATATTITLNVDSTLYTAYTSGGLATLVTTDTSQPQILPIGDNNFGTINASGRLNLGLTIPGAFINVSPG